MPTPTAVPFRTGLVSRLSTNRQLIDIQLMLDPQRSINIFSFLATVLLSCMGVRKKFSQIRPSPKKNSCCSTAMVHGTWKKLIDTRSPPKKIYIFVFGYSKCMELEKNINITRPTPKKNYFRFWLLYYCGAHD